MSEEQLIVVDLDQVRVNPYQPRKKFKEEEIQELAASIRSIGLIQPPIVRRLEDGTIELVAGERRLRALIHAGYKEAPVIFREYDESGTAHAALIENLQRSDLNAIEIAESLKDLMLKEKLTQEQLAVKVGKKRSTVANYLRLLQLPPKIQELIREGLLTMGHAKALLSIPEHLQETFCERIVGQRLSVRDAEEGARRIEKSDDLFLKDIEEKLRVKLGLRIHLKGEGVRGKVEIVYEDLDQLDRILEVLGAV